MSATEKTAFERAALLAEAIDGLTAELEWVREQKRDLLEAVERAHKLYRAELFHLLPSPEARRVLGLMERAISKAHASPEASR